MKFFVRHYQNQYSAQPSGLRWLTAEPYRVFFALGTIWSIIGVTLWPLFHQGLLSFYPFFAHARIMIESFGGAFVVGFLGTAGPRMVSAPKLAPLELLGLVGLHSASGASHLCGWHAAGDLLFAALLISVMLGLLIRMVRFGAEPPPPQLLLAFAGLLFGAAGAAMLAFPGLPPDPRLSALASLCLNQGLLLLPILGIGSFVFPRILGGAFGEPATAAEAQRIRRRTILAALLAAASFGLQAYGSVMAGCLLRAAVCLAYLLAEVSWRKQPAQGTLAFGLKAALAVGLAGLLLAAFASPAQRISIDHLLYIGGFGLLMLVVGSRVLFGHSGQLAASAKRSGTARIIVGLAILAAATRAVPALVPAVTVSHHQYAAITWAGLALIWLAWHRRRFVEREQDEAE